MMDVYGAFSDSPISDALGDVQKMLGKEKGKKSAKSSLLRSELEDTLDLGCFASVLAYPETYGLGLPDILGGFHYIDKAEDREDALFGCDGWSELDTARAIAEFSGALGVIAAGMVGAGMNRAASRLSHHARECRTLCRQRLSACYGDNKAVDLGKAGRCGGCQS